MVPIGSVANFHDETAPYRLPRYNLYPAADVLGSAGPGVASGTAMARMEVLAKEVLPPGFAIEWTELRHQQEQQGIPTLAIFAASALFVFLVLAAQYESWKLPLAIVLIVPMCLLASATGLDFRGMPIDILAQIGFVVLVGLAAKNAILIVEFARQRQDHDGDTAGRGGDSGRPDPASPDPDDLLRLHSRRLPARRGDRGRRGDAPIARDRGVLRHARRDHLRPAVHARLLHPRPQARLQERGPRGGARRYRRSRQVGFRLMSILKYHLRTPRTILRLACRLRSLHGCVLRVGPWVLRAADLSAGAP